MSRHLALTICMLAWPSGVLLAQIDIDSEISRCAAIASNLERLECYDQIALAQKVGVSDAQTVPANEVAGWIVQDQTNPVDDRRSVTLALAASNADPRSGQQVMLVLRCRVGRVEAYVDWQRPVGSITARVTTRIDTAPATAQDWRLSTDNTATFYPAADVDFFWELMPSEQFIAQVTPPGGNTVTAVFDLTGLTYAAAPLREACRV